MAIEGIIFDWAGTTVDYGSMSPVAAFEELFKSYGLTVTLEEIRKPMGLLKRDHIEKILNLPHVKQQFTDNGYQINDEMLDKMNNEFTQIIKKVLKDYSIPKPGVVEVVNQLKENGLKIGSTTGYTNEMMEIVQPAAQSHGYEPDFMATPDLTDGKGRPYPYMIFKNMEALGLSDVRKVIKVGDTVVDIQEANNAGVISVGVVEGSSLIGLGLDEFESLSQSEQNALKEKASQEFKEAGADYVIDSFNQILDLVDILK